jgi:hypothetical protein
MFFTNYDAALGDAYDTSQDVHHNLSSCHQQPYDWAYTLATNKP